MKRGARPCIAIGPPPNLRSGLLLARCNHPFCKLMFARLNLLILLVEIRSFCLFSLLFFA